MIEWEEEKIKEMFLTAIDCVGGQCRETEKGKQQKWRKAVTDICRQSGRRTILRYTVSNERERGDMEMKELIDKKGRELQL